MHSLIVLGDYRMRIPDALVNMCHVSNCDFRNLRRALLEGLVVEEVRGWKARALVDGTISGRSEASIPLRWPVDFSLGN
jgi:hypothetical protein